RVLVRGDAVGRQDIDIPIVSQRKCIASDGLVALKAENDVPAIIVSHRGRGRVYLLGFCLQDTLFQAWETVDHGTLREINGLLDAIASDGDIHSHIRASNGDIEAALRANQSEGFVIVIAHEPQSPKTNIRLRDLPFTVARVIDVESDQEIPMTRASDGFEMTLSSPTGA